MCNKLLRTISENENDIPVIYILEKLSSTKMKYKMNIGKELNKNRVTEFFSAYQ